MCFQTLASLQQQLIGMFLFLLARPQMYFQPSKICGLCHASFFKPQFGVPSHMVRGVHFKISSVDIMFAHDELLEAQLFLLKCLKGRSEREGLEQYNNATPHPEGKGGQSDGKERCISQNGNLLGKDCDVSQQSHLFGGEPGRSPPPYSVHIQTGGQTSGLHMNLRLLRETHTSWEGFYKCVHPLKTFLRCRSTPYITHAALFTTPPILVWQPNISPIPPLIHLLSAACTTPSHGSEPMRASAI